MTLLFVLVAGFALSGCVGAAVVGAGATTGLLVAQERQFGQGLDDSALDMNLQTRLANEGGKAMGRVDVNVHDGRVLLTGVVPTDEDRVKLARIAWSTPNVKEVINEVEVRGKAGIGRQTNDAWISGRLRTALALDRDVRNMNIGIETVRGTVYLFGKARSAQELEYVTAHARKIKGVQRVVSHVEVPGSEANGVVVSQR